MKRKYLSESNGMEQLRELRDEFAERMRMSFEHRAKPCSICDKPGSCCLDEHFVNVRISRLEAAAIKKKLDEMDAETRKEVDARIDKAIERYRLDAPGDVAERTYACPLFERRLGCLVHTTAKPLPCIAHACYENKKDLPPDYLLAEAEMAAAGLNDRVYGKPTPLQSIPIAIGGKDRSGI